MEQEVSVAEDIFAGGGEMGGLMRSRDWSQTPLGAVENWPSSLKTAVRLILGSRYPMFVWWGEPLTNFYNDAYIPVLGKRHPQALGQPASELWAEIWDTLGPQTAAVLHEGRSTWNRELLLIMERNGYPEETYFTFSYSPAASDDGSVGGVFCACSEDTQQVLGQRRLATLRELAAETIAATTPAAACAIAAAVLSRNASDIPFALFYLLEEDDRHSLRLAGTTGLAAGTLASPKRIDLTSPQTPDNWQLQQAIATGEIQIVTDLETKFGILPGGARAEPPRTAAVIPLVRSGETLGSIAIGVSPLRQLDDDLRGFFDLVAGQVTTAIANARAYQQQQQRAEALAEIDRAKTTFFNNISHEFRTPLTLMLGPIEDALSDRASPLPPQQRERIEVLQRNGLRLQKLVNTLLDFSRIEAGRIEAVCELTDLATFTAELASVFRSAIERANLRLTVDCPPLATPVWVDRQMWEKIVLNLLSNALKFTWEGEIAVVLQQRGSQLQLEVRDTGTGIPPEELPRIFERFHRVRGAAGRSWEGSGIGLSLVQELVRLQGGTIEVASTVDRGTTFTVSIPADRGDRSPSLELANTLTPAATPVRAAPYVEEALRWLPEQPTADSEKLSTLNSQLSTLNSPSPYSARILLVDDNADMRDYVKRLLLEGGYAVETASDGIAALAAVGERSPDLVLSDVMMPKLDGFGLLQELRANPNTRDIPIVLLSARAGGEAQIEGLAAGADDYLTKPFSGRELLGRVAACLQQAKFRREAMEREQGLRLEAETATNQVESILSSIRDGFFVLDRQWRYTYTNDRNCELVGMQRKQLLGNNLWELFPDVVGTEVWIKFDRALQEQTPVEFEYFYPTWQRWFDFRVYPSPSGLSVFVVDITQRQQTAAALQESQRFNQQVAETLPGLLYIYDAIEQRHVYINSQVRELLGYTPEQILEMGSEVVPKILHPDEIPQVALYLERCNASGPTEVMEIENRIQNANGEWRWFLDRTIVFSSTPEGKARQILGFGIDITDRKLALSALQESEERYRYLVESIPQLVWTADSQGNLLDINQRWSAYTGLTLDRAHTEGWQTVVHPEDLPAMAASWQAAQQAETHYQAEGRIRRCDGTYRWHLHQAMPIVDERGHIIKWFGTATDIQDRKQAEAALRASEELFRNLADNAPFMVWVTDPTGYCTYLSQSWYDFTGETEASSLGFGWLNVTHPADRESAERTFLAANEHREPFRLEYRLRRFDGEYIWAIDAACPLFGADGEFQGYVGSVIDITDRKQAEAERDRLLEQEKAARAEAEKANRIKDEFLAVLSHELRSPLNPILGWSKLLQSGRLDPQKTKLALETIERNAKLQTQLIEDLLDVSRILQGKLVLNQVPVPLTNTVEAAMETVRLSAEAKSIQIQKSLNLPAGKILGDSARLQQVIWNLLSNAIKFTPAGGTVEIRLEQIDNCAQIQVIDGGKGIKPEFLPYVFEYFRQEDGTTTRKFGGLGLGLAIVRYLTELHGGTVGAESPGEGLGATFTLRLPLIPAPTQTPRDNSPATSTIDLAGLRILVVDDEPDIQDIVSFILEDAGAEVSIASSALEALNSIEQSFPDVLVCDVGMPEMDGYMLMRLLRSRSADRGGEIPALALTAYAGEVDRQGAISAGFQRHLAKPADPDELIAAVKSLVS